MATVLTTLGIVKFKAKSHRYEVRDARSSLRLLVLPSGRKSWIMRFRRPDGRNAKLTLGRVHTGSETEGQPTIGGPLTLAGARKLAAEIDLARASGKDPSDQKRVNVASTDVGTTFADAARAFLREYASKRTRHWKVTARRLGLDPDGALRLKGLAERWRHKGVAAIDGHVIHRLIEETRKQGVPGTRRRRDADTDSLARSMHSTLSKMFAWLMSRREVSANPCVGVTRPTPPPARERVLSDDEIRALWEACEGPFGAAIKVMLITGARCREVAHMRRNELSADGKVWTLPAARSKNRREHTVPLPPLAREIIASMPTMGDYVFTFNERTPVAGFSLFKKRLDTAMRTKPWRIHDLRRTAVTGMARAGADLHVIERAINHVSGSFGGIVGVYQKFRYADAVGQALEAWADLLQRIVEPANVVELRRG
jgi:integrase